MISHILKDFVDHIVYPGQAANNSLSEKAFLMRRMQLLKVKKA